MASRSVVVTIALNPTEAEARFDYAGYPGPYTLHVRPDDSGEWVVNDDSDATPERFGDRVSALMHWADAIGFQLKIDADPDED